MNCSNCNTSNKETAHFCKSCGAKLVAPEVPKERAVVADTTGFPPALPEINGSQPSGAATSGTAAPEDTAPASYPPYPEEAGESNSSLFVLLLVIHAGLLLTYVLRHFIIPNYYATGGDKLMEYTSYSIEGLIVLLFIAGIVKVRNSSLKLGLFIFLMIRVGIDCFEYTDTRKATSGTPEMAAEQGAAGKKGAGKKTRSSDNEAATHRSGIPYEIAAIKGYMYYNSNREDGVKKVIGQLSDNIIDNEDITLWNTFIGAGAAEGVSNQTLVVVDVTGHPKEYTTRKIRLIATAAGEQLLKQTQDLALLSRDGKYKAAFLLYKTGAVPVTLKAQIINTEGGSEVVEATMTKTIEFESGE